MDATRLAEKLADPELYARDPESFTRTGAKLAETESAIAAAEEEWLRIEMLREELEQSS
jgi:ATP-binding cassette subfamily F protein uup